MSKTKLDIWIGEKDLNRDPEFIKSAQNEHNARSLVETLGDDGLADKLESNRRDFLKYLGFGLGAATIAASCEIPVKRAIPYLIKPDEIVPGVATYYASSFVKGGDYCSILVKTREGRPIKIEGNDLSKVTMGGTSARAQASVLDLYDVNRARNPYQKNERGRFEDISWSKLDSEVKKKLAASNNVRIVSNTLLSPSTKKVIGEFVAKYPSTKWISYDPVSSSAMLKANEDCFGERMIPNYKFEDARVIVSFNADFLGTWISPVEYAAKYVKNRKIKDHKHAKMSRHFQVESQMSLTGSNADNRILVKPSEQGLAIAYLYGLVSGASINANGLNEKAKTALQKVANELRSSQGESLVICGNNDWGQQVLANAINDRLGNIGKTVDLSEVSYQRQGNEEEMSALVNEMNSGQVDSLLILDANPSYDYAGGTGFAEALEKVNTKIALTYKVSETTKQCDFIAPINNYLEAWGDAEPKKGHISLIQPTISPLFDTRQAELSLLKWAESENLKADSDQPYFEYLKNLWQTEYFAKQSRFSDFQKFWDSSLHDGVFEYSADENSAGFSGDTSAAVASIARPSTSELEISFFETVNMANGQYSNNPWLQELPDPITRCVWGNYLAVPVNFDGVRKFIGFNKLKDGDLVELTVGDQQITVPIIQQFGQMAGTVSLALGYGRNKAGICGNGVGVNANVFTIQNGGYTQYYNTNVSVSNKVGEEDNFACVQYHHTMGVKDIDSKTGEEINADEAALIFATYGVVRQGYQGSLTERSVINQTNLKDLDEAVENLQEKRQEFEHLNQQTLYPYEEYKANNYSQGHHWQMHVDLNACIGCGACAVACMAENNVPVVGKTQVHRHQEMTWIRIDRYYYGQAENPNVVYQPLMCQHCDNAPCENVCPVNATSHSSEGLNQMAYNRCVGTRYCANNCPFKVRRFNWLDYTTADIFPANQLSINGEKVPYGADNLTRMVLNPDVTVRSRGVIEKCSFCVQRLQEGKLAAKQEGRALRDSDVKTACQTACPTGAIVFGDGNDKDGAVGKLMNDPMNYVMLEETNVRASVNYKMKVINRDESLDA